MTALIAEAEPDLVAVPFTNRLRCQHCHRFVGTVGTDHIVDEQCDVRYVLTLSGSYVRAPR